MRRVVLTGPGAAAVACGAIVLSLLWLAPTSCSEKTPFDPPDLLYLFATYPVGKNPTSVSTSDFNQDGFTDIMTTNIRSNTLSLLLGNGDGSFRKQVQIPTCKEPRDVAVSDYNRDGWVDLAVACSGSNQVRIRFGHAGGTFGVGPAYSVHRTPISLTSADMNGDHYGDLAVALRNDKIQILLGQGDGSFLKGPLYEYGDTPTSIAVTDLNGDDKPDLAVTNGGPMSNAVSIWRGNGDGSFQEPTDYRTGKRPLWVAFADFNNDRLTDLLVINGVKDSFTVFLGNGDGTFQDGKDDGANGGPVYGLARDFNGDRSTDVAIVNMRSNDLSILYGRGDGTFHYPPKNYPTKRGPFAIATLQLTSHHREEPGLAIANNGANSVSIFLHRGLGRRAALP